MIHPLHSLSSPDPNKRHAVACDSNSCTAPPANTHPLHEAGQGPPGHSPSVFISMNCVTFKHLRNQLSPKRRKLHVSVYCDPLVDARKVFRPQHRPNIASAQDWPPRGLCPLKVGCHRAQGWMPSSATAQPPDFYGLMPRPLDRQRQAGRNTHDPALGLLQYHRRKQTLDMDNAWRIINLPCCPNRT